MTDDDDDDELEDLDALAKGMDRGRTAPLPKAASAADTATNIGTLCCIKHECVHWMSGSELTLSTESCIWLYCNLADKLGVVCLCKLSCSACIDHYSPRAHMHSEADVQPHSCCQELYMVPL